MEKKKMCLVGHDDDGVMFAVIAIVLLLIVMLVLFLIYVSVYIILYGGGILGGFFSIRNYVISLKHNIWDSNFGSGSLRKAA